MADNYDYDDWNNDSRGAQVEDSEKPTHSRLLGPDGNRLQYKPFKFGFQPPERKDK